MKRVRMIELNAEARELPENLADYAIDNDGDPIVIEDLEATRENVDKAMAWLASKRSTATHSEGYAMGFYQIKVYAVEHYTADDDGEFLEGSDYEVAEVE